MLVAPTQSHVDRVVNDLKVLAEGQWWEMTFQEAIVLIDDLARVNTILSQALRERHCGVAIPAPC